MRYDQNSLVEERDWTKLDLTTGDRMMFIAWLAGTDFQKIMARTTWFRRRAKILKATGFDIAFDPPSRERQAQIGMRFFGD